MKKSSPSNKGIYSEYLNRKFNSFNDITLERKKQLHRIALLRGHDVLVYAADLKKNKAPILISYPDILPITDQLSGLKGNKSIDLILETPGGYGEIAEQIVRLIHHKYPELSVIVPGCAKSAGTIMAMAANEILMEPFVSALGPIDAQLNMQGKTFSAEALLKGFDRIKKEVVKTSQLNRAYIPILQGISPGELEHAENALNFAKQLVAQWLAKCKFKNWKKHRTKGKSTYGKPVTNQQKKIRAEQIAKKLCNHSTWKSHGRSIVLSDLEAMRLEITDYSKQPKLSDAIRRYFTLLQMTFDTTTIYKIFETPDSHIYRFMGSPVPQQISPGYSRIEIECDGCKARTNIQANFNKGIQLEKDHIPFPPDNKFKCSKCGLEHDLSNARRQIELQSKKTIVT